MINPEKLNTTEASSNETGTDVNIDKKLEGELTQEQLQAEKALEQKLELSTEEQINNVDAQFEVKQQQIEKLTKSGEETRAKLNSAREALGLSPAEEDSHSISSEKSKLEKLKSEQSDLEKQKEELVSKQEKEKLIKAEKEKLLQDKFNKLFDELKALNPKDFESILKSGRKSDGSGVESKSLGSISPENAQTLARILQEGIKLLPKILENLPGLLKEFDKDLEKEATENVDKKIEEEKQQLEENKLEEGMSSEQKEISRNKKAEGIMTDKQKSMSEIRARENTEEKAA